MPEKITDRNLENELEFSASRSSGPGGQNVNKVNSRIELRFNIYMSVKLNKEEKNILIQRLANRLTKEGELIIVCQTERSQFENKLKVIAKFYDIIGNALKPIKKRYATKPTRSSKLKRLERKHHHSEKKSLRRAGWED